MLSTTGACKVKRAERQWRLWPADAPTGVGHVARCAPLLSARTAHWTLIRRRHAHRRRRLPPPGTAPRDRQARPSLQADGCLWHSLCPPGYTPYCHCRAGRATDWRVAAVLSLLPVARPAASSSPLLPSILLVPDRRWPTAHCSG